MKNKNIFNQVISVKNIDEAINLANAACLEKKQFKICNCVSDLFGVKLPTEKQLYILPKIQFEAERRGLI